VNSVAVAPGQTIVARISGPTSWRSTSHSARTPHERVEPAEAGRDVIDKGHEILATGDVDDADARLSARARDLLCNPHELLLAARSEHDPVAPRGEQPTGGGADATARTRDRDDLTGGLHDQKMTDP